MGNRVQYFLCSLVQIPNRPAVSLPLDPLSNLPTLLTLAFIKSFTIYGWLKCIIWLYLIFIIAENKSKIYSLNSKNVRPFCLFPFKHLGKNNFRHDEDFPSFKDTLISTLTTLSAAQILHAVFPFYSTNLKSLRSAAVVLQSHRSAAHTNSLSVLQHQSVSSLSSNNIAVFSLCSTTLTVLPLCITNLVVSSSQIHLQSLFALQNASCSIFALQHQSCSLLILKHQFCSLSILKVQTCRFLSNNPAVSLLFRI